MGASLYLGQTWPRNKNCVAVPKPAPTEDSTRWPHIPSRCWQPTWCLADKACGFFSSFMLPSMQAQVVNTELLLRVIKDQIIFLLSL